MGNAECCCRSRKQELTRLTRKQSNSELHLRARRVQVSRWQNGALSVVNGGTIIASIVVLASGGPPTLVITLVAGAGGLIYCITADCCFDASEQKMVERELSRRSFAEISLVKPTSAVGILN